MARQGLARLPGIAGLLATVLAAAAAAAEPAPVRQPRPLLPLPEGFVESAGPGDQSACYILRGRGAAACHTAGGIIIQTFRREPGVAAGSCAVRVSFAGARPVEPAGERPLPGRVSRFIGSDAARWRAGMRCWGAVVYRELYDGIDLRSTAAPGQAGLKYEFRAAAGSDPRRIAMAYDGAEGLRLDSSGALHIRTPLGEVVDAPPRAWQDAGGGREAAVAVRYRLIDERTCGFEIGEYDAGRELVIDPDLAWATFVGGSLTDSASAVVADAAGNAIVVGETYSPDFDAAGGFDTIFNGGEYDVFVAKLAADAGAPLWSAFLGGGGCEAARAVAVDSAGDVLVTGFTESANFPVPDGIDTTLAGRDAFVVKISADGRSLLWGTFLGGTGADEGRGLAIAAGDDVIVAGQTASANFTMSGEDTTYNGGSLDGFVMRLTAAGQPAWSTFLGGAGRDAIFSAATDAAGDLLLAGQTDAADLPHARGAYRDGSDAFVAKMSGAGVLQWTLYLGGSGWEQSWCIAWDRADGAFVTGQTDSADFPAANAFDITPGGGRDGFVARVSGEGALLWAACVGGSGYDETEGVACDAAGSVFVTGQTDSADFPLPGGFDTTPGGGRDAFAAKLAPGGQLLWATLLGGSGGDRGKGIAVDAGGNVIVAGYTGSSDLPRAGAAPGELGGPRDAFAARIWCAPNILSVRSLPVTGVPIGGDKPGTTNYAAACEPGQSVTLSAPAFTLTPEGVRYNFTRWTVDEQPGPDGQADVQVAVNDYRRAVAVYAIQTHTLAVRSEPPGVPVAGGKPGLAPYDATCDDRQIVNLWAPDAATVGGARFNFTRWVVDGQEKEAGVTALQVLMAGDVAATAVYEIQRHTLTVESAPVPGIEIGGDLAGTTPFSAVCVDQQVVRLTAPASLEPGGVLHVFARWVVGGWPRPDRQADLEVTVDADMAAVAVYGRVWHVDDDAPADFATIQAAVEAAAPGDMVVVRDGTYSGPGNRDTDLRGKVLEVCSAAGPTHCVIRCGGSQQQPHSAFLFQGGEGRDTVVRGFTITGGYSGDGGAVYCNGASPTLHNNVIAGNTAWFGAGVFCFDASPLLVNNTITRNTAIESGGGIYSDGASAPAAANCIVWGNTGGQIAGPCGSVTFSDVKGGFAGTGNFDLDPLFANAAGGDFHLRAEFGRWDPAAANWVLDAASSLCIDAGDPAADYALEAMPNGERVNVGAYGNTPEASKSPRILSVRSQPLAAIAISGDKPGTTDYTASCADGSTIRLLAPLDGADGNVRYLFARWLVDGQPRPDGQADVDVPMTANRTATAVYEILTHPLEVRSLPVAGVQIEGDKAGATDYTATCEDRQVVTLAAPLLHATPLNVHYNFSRWLLDGLPQDDGAATLAAAMDSARSAVAVYTIQTHPLHVRSSPPAGVAMAGDRGGVTDYTAICDDQEVARVAAPWRAGGLYLLRWLIATGDGGWATLTHRGECAVTIAGETTIMAEYGPASEFYVNDAAPDGGIAAGDDANPGTSPDGPMAGIGALLGRYPEIAAGCVAHAAAGRYRENVIVGAGHSGLELRGAGPGRAVIDGGQAGPCLRLDGFSGIVRGFTLTNGRGDGGGVACAGGAPVIRNCVISHNSADGSGGGIRCDGGRLRAVNVTLTGNSAAAGGAISISGGTAEIADSILWGNTAAAGREVRLDGGSAAALSYCDVGGGQASVDAEAGSGCAWGPGMIDADPLFAGAGHWDDHGTPGDSGDDIWVDADCHLQSKYGRWDPGAGAWAADAATSPCLDAGDPAADVSAEPQPNYGRVNLGAYGNTAEASKSGWNIPGDVDASCVVNILDLLIVRDHLRMNPSAGGNWPSDVNRDGKIDILDLLFVRDRLTSRCR